MCFAGVISDRPGASLRVRLRQRIRVDDVRFALHFRRSRVMNRHAPTHVEALFDAAFREYGLPQVIHTDNGAPCASCASAGLSRLSMRWVKLGITPERSRPASPQDNGRHEVCT